jgi:hypothetical protein
MFMGGLQGKFVPVSPETEQTTAGDVTEITIVPKLFPRKCIAQVYFDKRNLNGEKGIAQSYACVRETTRIQDNKIDPIDLSLLDPVNEFVFGVTLKA